MRFLVDAQLPPTLARWLGEQGLSATPVREVGLRDADDGSILNFATTGGWTLITKDEDFAMRSAIDPAAPPVVWVRLGNCTNKSLFALLQPHIDEIRRRLESGEKLVEVCAPGK